jgi:hypothetical protein
MRSGGLRNDEAPAPRFMPVSVTGVDNWRGITGKVEGANGDRRDVKGIIPDMERIFWKGRRVVIAFDSRARRLGASRRASPDRLERRDDAVSTVGFELEQVRQYIREQDAADGAAGQF